MYLVDSVVAKIRNRTTLLWAALLLILLLSWWLRVEYLWRRHLDFDEALELVFGLLVNSGHPAYSDTFVVIAPLALLLIQLGAKLFGTFLAFRYPLMLFSLIGIAGIFFALQPWKNSRNLIAGLLAAVLLSFNPTNFTESTSIGLEVPAVALSIVSVVLAQQYYFRQNRGWIFGSGIAFSLSLALKPFVIFIPVLIAALVIYHEFSAERSSQQTAFKKIAIDGLFWLGGAAIPIVIIVLLYNPQAMYQQIIVFRLVLREKLMQGGYTVFDNLPVLGGMLFGELTFLLVLTLPGLWIGWRRQRPETLLWGGWLILATVLLFWQIPLRSRYVVMLLPPLAVFSGMALSWGICWLAAQPTHAAIQRASMVIPILVIIVFAIVGLWSQIGYLPRLTAGNFIFSDRTPRPDMANYLKTILASDDCIITDDQRYSIFVDRYPPPFLSEISRARTRAGWMLSTQDIVEAIQKHECPAVIYSHGGLPTYLPELEAELQKLYFLEISYTDRIRMYLGNKHVNRKPKTSLEATLGQSITLHGIDLNQSPWHSTQSVQLATYWSAVEPPTDSYKIFLHLRNDQNETVAKYDHFPFPVPDHRYQLGVTGGGPYKIYPNIDHVDYSGHDFALYPTRGMIPTTVWPIGRTIREVTTMKLPADLPPGTYQLYIGLYNPDTLERLPVQQKGTKAEELLLATVEIVSKPGQ